MFTCHQEEKASALPIAKDMFDLIAMYEVKSEAQNVDSCLHPEALGIFNHSKEKWTKLDEYMNSFSTTDEMPANFNCIRDESGNNKFSQKVPDQRVWKESKPSRIGLYHAFVRTHTNDALEHKLFIIVSGCMSVASEELQNLWQDSKHILSCREFVESVEAHWLRQATLRNHNRIAYEVSLVLGLQLNISLDMDDPTGVKRMAVPVSYNYKNDMCIRNSHVLISDQACFLHKTENGVLFEMFANEGYWMLNGPKDYAQGARYGYVTEKCRYLPCMPVRTIQIHGTHQGGAQIVKVDGGTFFFPDKKFTQELENLGFNRDDGILHFMPIIRHGH